MNPCPPRLKLFAEEHPDVNRPAWDGIRGLDQLADTFEQASGWRLQLSSTAPDRSAVTATIATSEATAVPALPRPAAEDLAKSIAELASQLQSTREQLWRAEAELAACVPVTVRSDHDQRLAERLEAVLRGACESVEGDSAALYLLDDNSTHVKLRACFGLSHDSLLAPARSLEGSLAELEALLGHAVVIEDAELLPTWPIPEDYAAGACVPIASDTTLLGVLWVFSETRRDFTPQETGMMEIAAGRIASDLERTALLREAVDSKQVSDSLQRAVAWRRNRTPNVAPLLDDWQIAGWSSAGDALSGDWYDWSILPDGRLAVALCDADGDQIEAALNATAMHSAFRAHAAHKHQPATLLQQLNDTLWSSSAGGDGGSLAYAAIDPESGAMTLSATGCVCALQVRDRAHRTLRGGAMPLGYDPDLEIGTQQRDMARGDLMVLVSGGVLSARDASGNAITSSAIARAARTAAGQPERVIAAVRQLLDAKYPYGGPADRTILVVRRR